MDVRTCSARPILEPCELGGFIGQIDPYIGCEHHCQYCYALNQAETDWTREILIHQDIIGQLDHELSVFKPDCIYMGWNADAYQPIETSYRQTRAVLELLTRRGFSVCMLTKSDLVLRDIDLYAKMPNSSVGISLAFQEDDVRRLFEANTPPNEARIEALKEFNAAKIETYALICPLMPYITDVRVLIEQVTPFADTIWVYGLSMDNLSDRNWRNVEQILNQHFPDLSDNYREIAFSTDHPHWRALRSELESIRVESGLDLRIKV